MENIEAAMKRIPPHSIEAEQAVLGAMLMNKDAVQVASEMLTGDDFYQTAYGILFDAVVDLFKEGRPVDLITLQEHLKEKDVPPEVSSMEYARELLEGTQTSANIKYYAEIVKDKAILRTLIRINEDIANACYLENRPLEDILNETEKRVFELVENGNSQEYVPIKQVVLTPGCDRARVKDQGNCQPESPRDSLIWTIAFRTAALGPGADRGPSFHG